MPSHVESLHQLAEDANQLTKTPKRGSSRYMRAALVKIGRLTPEEYQTYQPKNMWEQAAMHLVDKATTSTKADSIQAFNTMRDTLGEKIATPSDKDTKSVKGQVAFFNDVVPFADRKASN